MSATTLVLSALGGAAVAYSVGDILDTMPSGPGAMMFPARTMAVVLVGGYLFGGVAGALSALVGGFGLSEMMRSMLQADKIRTQGSKTGFTTLVPLKGK